MCMYVCMCVHVHALYLIQFVKTRHNDGFFWIWKSVSEFHVPKALICSNINALLQIVYELQGNVDSKRSNRH